MRLSLLFAITLLAAIGVQAQPVKKFRHNINIETSDPAILFNGEEVAIGVAADTFDALTDSSGGSAADGTIGTITAPTAITDSSGGSASATLAASTGQRSGYVYYQNVTAATTSAGADQLDISGGVGPMLNIVQPDVPRNLVLNFTDGNASINAFQVDVVGVATDGSAVTEQFLFAGGLDQTGSKVFAKVTSVTVTSATGNGAADTLDIGYGVKLGVPIPVGSTSFSIVKLVANAIEENASATDTTNNSFTATTAPNATNDYEVWYEFIDAQSTLMRNAIASLAARQAENRTAIVALQDAVKELATQSNTIRTAVRAAGVVE